MLMPDPAVLRGLLTRYRDALGDLRAGAAHPDARRRLEDVSYTLCVSTGTRHVEEALSVARTRLAAHGGTP